MLTHRPLRNFRHLATRRLLYVLTLANVGGLAGGYLLAAQLTRWVPALPGPLVYALLLGAGLLLTIHRQERYLYQWAGLWLGYQARRLGGPGALVLRLADYYPLPPPGGDDGEAPAALVALTLGPPVAVAAAAGAGAIPAPPALPPAAALDELVAWLATEARARAVTGGTPS